MKPRPPRCSQCRADMEMVDTPTGPALVCPRSPQHPVRVVITEETRVACEVLGKNWAAVTNYTETGTGPVNWAK